MSEGDGDPELSLFKKLNVRVCNVGPDYTIFHWKLFLLVVIFIMLP